MCNSALHTQCYTLTFSLTLMVLCTGRATRRWVCLILAKPCLLRSVMFTGMNFTTASLGGRRWPRDEISSLHNTHHIRMNVKKGCNQSTREMIRVKNNTSQHVRVRKYHTHHMINTHTPLQILPRQMYTRTKQNLVTSSCPGGHHI